MQLEYLIGKKLSGQELNPDELKWLMSEWLRNRITDTGMKNFLHAARRKGLTFNEMLGIMHLAMISDEQLDLRSLAGVKVQLHSVNGICERIALMAGAICAAVGLPTILLSSPSLGCTLSPLDKLQSVPGFTACMDYDSFLFHAKRQRFAVLQTPQRLAPAAIRLYELCTSAGLMSPVPFFAPLEMAHVLAGGADAILLDVPFGENCIVQTENEAVILARTMCALGEAEGRKMGAIVTHLDTLPGNCIGAASELADEVAALNNDIGSHPLKDLAADIATRLLLLSGQGTPSSCRKRTQRVIDIHIATSKLLDMAEEQGGNPNHLAGLELFPDGCCQHPVRARRNGWISQPLLTTLEQAALALKAIRQQQADQLDPKAAIILLKHAGEYVKKGEEIAILCASRRGHFALPAELVRRACSLSDTPPPKPHYIHAWISGNEVTLIPPPAEKKTVIPDNVIHHDFKKGGSL